MFQLQSDMARLDLPAERVARLYRSMGSAQVAMPGYPAQPVSAGLCAFATPQGIRAAIGLNLETSGKLVLYVSDKAVPKERMQRLVDEGLQFVEAMGLFLDDMEFHRMPPDKREKVWSGFVLHRGADAPKVKAPGSGKEPVPRPAPQGFSHEEPALELTAADLVEDEPVKSPRTAKKAMAPPGSAGKSFTHAEPSDPFEARKKRLLERLGRFLGSM